MSGLNDLWVCFEVKSINCSWKVLELNCRFCKLKSIFSKGVFESRNKFFGFRLLLKESTVFYFLLKKLICVFKFSNKSFVCRNILFEYFVRLFFYFVNWVDEFCLLFVEFESSCDSFQSLFGKLFRFNCLDKIRNITTFQFLHVDDEPSLLNFSIDGDRFLKFVHLLGKSSARLGKSFPLNKWVFSCGGQDLIKAFFDMVDSDFSHSVEIKKDIQ